MLKFIFGALVGATIALFLAPKSGEELRENLADQENALASSVARRWRETFHGVHGS
jgi:gas vesicle protein